MGAAFLIMANCTYDSLRAKLVNSFMMGEDHYPTLLMEAYNLLLHWRDKSASSRAEVQRPQGGDHMLSAQSGNAKSKKGGGEPERAEL